MSCPSRFFGLKALKHSENMNFLTAQAGRMGDYFTNGTMNDFLMKICCIIPNSA
jgi:hypothetical protein